MEGDRDMVPRQCVNTFFLIRRYHAVWRLLNSDEILSAVKILQQLALEKANREEAARELEQKMEEERLRVERELVQAEEIERVRRREEEDELRRIAEAREASARLEAERDRALQSSVRLGVEGMKHSLEILKKNTVGLEGQDDIQAMVSAEEYRNALCSLHKLVEQMVKHPEEEKYRRIRRDHEGFLTDIGRFEGGIEFLIATGFFFTMVEGIKSLVCREPSLEVRQICFKKQSSGKRCVINVLRYSICCLLSNVNKLFESKDAA